MKQVDVDLKNLTALCRQVWKPLNPSQNADFVLAPDRSMEQFHV